MCSYLAVSKNVKTSMGLGEIKNYRKNNDPFVL
jgi:Na+-transporting NADH:ubiquinone oxidoreductase subunit NqrE